MGLNPISLQLPQQGSQVVLVNQPLPASNEMMDAVANSLLVSLHLLLLLLLFMQLEILDHFIVFQTFVP